ncbi:MAG TPA: hypothetical protein VD699_03730 [Nitrosopumilaceae archaeon]|nr:hypothetical protein [Nitrosopumilaceae archaeon]
MNSKAKIGVIILISAAVIGLLYPILIGLPGQDENIIPRDASKWHIGKGAEYNPIMHYDVTSADGVMFSVKIEFFNDMTKKQMILVQIDDNATGKKIDHKTSLSSAYTFEEVSGAATPYFQVLDETIFAIRDIALEDKYLVKKAVWDTVFIGALTQNLVVTEHGKTSFTFDSVDAFTVSYNIGNKVNKFWIVDNLPLPVKAEVYDIDGNLQYSYELISLLAPLTPGFS